MYEVEKLKSLGFIRWPGGRGQQGGSRALVLQRYKRPLAWREWSTGVSEGGSRELVLQRDNFPLARLEGSTGQSEGGSRALVLQRSSLPTPPFIPLAPPSSPPGLGYNGIGCVGSMTCY